MSRRSADLDVVVHRLTGKLLDGLDSYDDAKRRLAERTEVYARKFPGDPGSAELAARGDYLRGKAISDCTWLQAEIQTYAAAITALRGAP